MVKVVLAYESKQSISAYDVHLLANGFAVEHVNQLENLPSTIATLAKMGGKIDAIGLLPVVGNSRAHSAQVDRASRTLAAIRSLPDELTFMGAVKARSVPVVAVIPQAHVHQWPSYKWTTVIVSHGTIGMGTTLESSSSPMYDNGASSNSYDFSEVVSKCVGEWRKLLLDELENVGYAISRNEIGQLEVSPVLHRKRQDSDILAPQSDPNSLRRGQFLILGKDLVEEYAPFHEFQYLLNNYIDIANAESIKPETVFQRFFESHPEFIQRDQFDQTFPKPRLPIPALRTSYQPDFVQRPISAATCGTKWEILDLKLPNDGLLTSRNFHPDASAKLYHAIRQLRNYREYFNRDDVADQLVETFGLHPRNPKLAVVIGRRDRMENPSLLDQALGPTNLDVELISYDEILDLREKRLGLTSLFAKYLEA